jgi:CheY-like chemotaxis protein
MSGQHGDTRLHNKRVFIVEDEPLIALTLQDMLESIGCKVVARAMTLERARRCLDEPFDLAVLDVNIGGSPIDPISQALTLRRIPFVLATGYTQRDVDGVKHTHPLLQKPYDEDALRCALLEALSAASAA